MWEETQSAPAQTSSKKRFDKKLLTYGLIGLVILILVVVSGYFFIQYQNAQKLLSNNGASQEEVQKIVQAIGKLVELPKDETPTLATVADKVKVSNQPFFAKAENGDKVLVYPKNKMAVLYRPGTNKIINFATGVNIGQGNTAPTPDVAGATDAPEPTSEPTATTAPTRAVQQASSPTPSPSPAQ